MHNFSVEIQNGMCVGSLVRYFVHRTCRLLCRTELLFQSTLSVRIMPGLEPIIVHAQTNHVNTGNYLNSHPRAHLLLATGVEF